MCAPINGLSLAQLRDLYVNAIKAGALPQLLAEAQQLYNTSKQSDARIAARKVLEQYDIDPLYLSQEWLDLYFGTNFSMERARQYYMDGYDYDIQDSWPAWEFIRAKHHEKKDKRDWKARWKKAGEYVGWEGVHKTKMVALKSSLIWKALGTLFDDSLGNPYPPFAIGSGMGVEEVERDDVIALGLIDEDWEPPKQ